MNPWTVACQAPLSMGFSRQDYWSGLPCPPPEDLPHPGIEPASITSLLDWQEGSLPLAPPGKPYVFIYCSPFKVITKLDLPVVYNIFLYLIYFIHSSLYLLILYKYLIPPCFPLTSCNHQIGLDICDLCLFFI